MIEVMIIEDDPMVMEITNKYIQTIEGFHVKFKATNGEMALKELKKSTVDLLIIDIHMNEMSGLDVLEELRKNERLMDALFVTATTDSSVIDRAFKYGAVDYLIKPFSYERFKKALENYHKRFEIFHGEKGDLTQSQLDEIVGVTINLNSQTSPKGLHRRTLSNIRDFINKSESQDIQTNEIAEKLGISIVTVRKYMEYLVDVNEVALLLDYGTIGRPSYIYRKLNS